MITTFLFTPESKLKSVEELQSLYEEMEQAYNTIAMSDMEYDPATIDYAKKCRDDAQEALGEALYNLSQINLSNFGIEENND